VFTYFVENQLLATYYAAFVIREFMAVVCGFVRRTDGLAQLQPWGHFGPL
jgi:hypothetical protein